MKLRSRFSEQWLSYLKKRNIDKPDQEAVFPESFNVDDRDKFYKEISISKWAGSIGKLFGYLLIKFGFVKSIYGFIKGSDAVIIAYDALVGSRNNWNELCLRGMLHSGDNDSTGCIAGSWYGALYGFENVPENNYIVSFIGMYLFKILIDIG